MFTISIANAIVGSRYVSGSRNREGIIREAIRQDYSDQYKIRVMDENYGEFWATIEVVAE